MQGPYQAFSNARASVDLQVHGVEDAGQEKIASDLSELTRS